MLTRLFRHARLARPLPPDISTRHIAQGPPLPRYRIIPQTWCTDWYGNVLPPQYRSRLIPGCNTRIVVQELLRDAGGNVKGGRGEAPYLKVLRIHRDSDGSGDIRRLDGTVLDWYRDAKDDKGNGLAVGDLVRDVKASDINEIPLGKAYQPEEYCQLVADLEPTDETFYPITGIRELPDESQDGGRESDGDEQNGKAGK